ncbi:MAG TPA: polymer-forming cytoskeletal protein [Thermoanaerobaculia bacterium]|jgi:cytoskeletal protein CcmA (bactofilin family)
MAWKKSDDSPSYSPPEPAASNPPRPAAAPAPAPSPVSAAPSEPPPRRTDRATIGPSIFIKGDLSGEEDLVIEGRVEGKVDLKQNNVTIGKNGKVHADLFGRVVTIEGEVNGNVFAREQAILRQSGAIRGNITAPRVVLEDGSRFKGSIDMEPPKETGGGAQVRQADSYREVNRERENRDANRENREVNRPEPTGVKATA